MPSGPMPNRAVLFYWRSDFACAFPSIGQEDKGAYEERTKNIFRIDFIKMRVHIFKRRNMSEILPYPENNEALLQELVLRLAIIPGNPRTRDPKLLVRQIPEDLPFSLALP